ncbi:hypothetical protein C8N40_10641 [Pontibacter mucosus]|uniref:SRPBCC family protein n=1 Tax=Pontibacter mucosus TaxID=1649266 RepID=A0A2T5YG09_9BACT|nr:hypothetical protein [Pontibacter mucosus]PTX18242.1 hypothetical protein C8N40_10641 [Pontibacter mucosus]
MEKENLSQKLVFTATALVGYVALIAAARRWYLQWGATADEIAQPLPGDELMDHASANHAITIQAPVQAVWPWLKQIGQDKAGFYSYSFLENLVAADIHNTNRVVPEWQHLKAGDTIRLASKKVYGDKPLLPVVALEENHYLVLKGWGAFVLKPLDSHTSRLLIRSHGRRYGWGMRLLLFLLLDPIHFLMERRMLIGLKERAERAWQQDT